MGNDGTPITRGKPAAQKQSFSLWRASMTNPTLFPFIADLRRALRGAQSVLDIGCGKWSPMRFISGLRLTGVDGHAPSLEEAQRNGTHDEYVLGDVRRLVELFGDRRFDACVALDLIEHLPKEDGWRLLDQMEKLAKTRVIIFTPNGFVPQQSRDGDLQEHLSGWTPGEMRARHYEVFGMGGPSSLRGEYHRLKYRPRVFWAVVSVLAHYLQTHSHPEKAAAILCVKTLDSA